MQNKIELIKNAGIIGEGGAGFPAYFKLSSKADIVIANGAECEPLLYSDQWIMKNFPERVLKGLFEIKSITGAKRAVLALKSKYKECILALKKYNDTYGIEIFELDNFYPAGDEQTLVYEVSGKIVPEGGIPINVGAIVSNVGTIFNIACALEDGSPLIKRVVTVTGEVDNPIVGFVPIGTKISELLKLASLKLNEFGIIDGGPMMGKLITEDDVVNKTTSGILVLPLDNPIIKNRSLDIERELMRDFMVCCNCSECTLCCPRYQLGHRLKPHQIMQSLIHHKNLEIPNAWLCCECGACEYACPMGLSPRHINHYLKDILKKNNIKNSLNFKPEQSEISEIG